MQKNANVSQAGPPALVPLTVIVAPPTKGAVIQGKNVPLAPSTARATIASLCLDMTRLPLTHCSRASIACSPDPALTQSVPPISGAKAQPVGAPSSAAKLGSSASNAPSRYTSDGFALR